MSDKPADDDVPPLEDMSELLQQAKQLQQVRETKQSMPTASKSKTEETAVKKTSPDNSNVSSTAPGTPIKDTQSDEKGGRNKTAADIQKSASKSSNSFGGMKKGFLFGSASKSSNQTIKNQNRDGNRKSGMTQKGTIPDIPVIKPKEAAAENGAHSLPEVQEALKASAPFLNNKDWITDDLLTKIEKNPRLARQLGDPRFSQAMAMFQTNPQGAMKHFQNNPEIQTFFKDFCEILGGHFLKLGQQSQMSNQNSPLVSDSIKVHDQSGAEIKAASSTDPKQPTADDEARMRELMSDPAVVKAFSDPRTRILFEALRTSPDKAQRMMRNADAEFKSHIQVLVDKGLLGFAR